jgi:hypothetical protein
MQWPDDQGYGAHSGGQARFAEADGSLRPPNRAAHMDLPDSGEERESSSGLGFIAVLSAAIIVLAGVVGIRQWSAERELERSGRTAAGAPEGEPSAPIEPAGPDEVAPPAAPTAPLPAAAVAAPSGEVEADAGAAGQAVGGAAAVVRRPGLAPQQPGPRPGLRRPLAGQGSAPGPAQFAPMRPPMRGPGADLPVKQHVGVPDNPY